MSATLLQPTVQPSTPSSKPQSPSSARPAAPQHVANGRFKIDKKLGAGCFGEVYLGVNVKTKQEVAVKFEDLQAPQNQLDDEADLLKRLGRPRPPQGFTQCYYSGVEGPYRCLVMDFLGKDLEASVKTCKGKFAPLTTALVADQLMCRAEYLHSKGIVHQDIKTENFMWGTKDKVHHLYMIDFGLSKRYFVDKTHVPISRGQQMTGTARFASINANYGVAQSRRDDLEAIGHMLLFFLRGKLPWSGLYAKTEEERFQKILERKAETPLNELCADQPPEFQTFLHYARNLEYEECPDYRMCRKLFRDVRDRLGPAEDHELQWLAGSGIDPKSLTPLAPWDAPSPCQPDSVGYVENPPAEASRRAFCFCGGQAPRDD